MEAYTITETILLITGYFTWVLIGVFVGGYVLEMIVKWILLKLDKY